MPTPLRQTADAIARDNQDLARRVDALQVARDPGLPLRYADRVRAELCADLVYELRVLSNAMAMATPLLFDEYMRWLSDLRAARHIGAVELHAQLACLDEVLCSTYPGSAYEISGYLGSARGEIGRPYADPRGTPPLGSAAQEYLALVLTGERARAVSFVNDALDQGTSVHAVYLEIIEAAQREVGRLWQLDQLSVAQEHFATAVGQLVLAQLYPRIMHASRGGPRLVASCVSGELHEMGARMVADFFEMDGWDTMYLGANTPTDSLLQILQRPVPAVLALSATNSFQVSAVASIIEAVRNEPSLRDLKVLVGGRPFQIASELWQRVGADAYAPDARAAVRAGRALLTQH